MCIAQGIHLVLQVLNLSRRLIHCGRILFLLCEREGIVGGDEGPVGGVAQVVSHGVKVVGVHREEGKEKDEEVRGEVKGEVEQLRDNRTCAWREDGMTDSRDDLSQCGCDA